MKKSTALNRKTSRMIAKNLIILLVLAVITFLTIWAWFAKGSTAEADGVSIKSKADGVDVSWDNKDFYKDLTALTDDEVVAKQIGLAKNISGKKGEPYPIKLITGNGLKFFEPYLNRRTGDVLLNADNSWQGIDIVKSEGKYVDIPLYFRGSAAKDIYLAGDSFVLPKDENARMSDFGDFSTDYICAASRVAFLDSTKKNCSFVWAPNANYELQETENGYTRVENMEEEEGPSSGGNLSDDIPFTTNNGTYYLWLPTSYSSDPNTQASTLFATQMKFTVYDEKNGTGLYTCDYTINEPGDGKTTSLIYYINQSGTTWSDKDIQNIDVSKSAQNNESTDGDPKVVLSDSTFNLEGQDRRAPIFYVSSFEKATITITIGYNPDTKETIIISYSGPGKDYNRAGQGSSTISFYELTNGANAALVSPEASVAISAGDDLGKTVSFKNVDKKNVMPRNIMLTEQFTVEKTGEGSQATYKFKNKKTNTRLTVTNGKISFTNAGTSFTLADIEGFVGPALKAGNYYLVAQNGELKGVTEANLEKKNLITVYLGSSYALYKNSIASQNYEYYDSAEKKIIKLGSGSTPKLFSTVTDTDSSVLIGNTKVATLAKANEDDEYYTAMIYIRIWAEGTDRDAKTPLANGIFDTSLHFTAK